MKTNHLIIAFIHYLFFTSCFSSNEITNSSVEPLFCNTISTDTAYPGLKLIIYKNNRTISYLIGEVDSLGDRRGMWVELIQKNEKIKFKKNHEYFYSQELNALIINASRIELSN